VRPTSEASNAAAIEQSAPWAGRRAHRQVRKLLLVTLVGLLLVGCATEDRARQLNREGNAAYDAGDYQSALDRYREAQVESPDESAYIYNGGNALHRLRQFDRAVTESQRAAASGTDDVRFRAYYALGNHYVRQDKLREARDAYKNALKVIPHDLDAKFNLEVVQRRLDEQQRQREQQQQEQRQQNQEQGQQGQQDQVQPGQQPGQQPPGQQQPGQQQPGQQDPQQQGQPNDPQQPAQPGQQQPGQQPGQGPTQPQEGQFDQLSPQELDRALREAVAEYERSLSVESALRILEILEAQRRQRQNQVPPQPGNQRDQ
jgi:Ca-activated chloride channel family protein